MGTTASLLLASGFAITVSANEGYEKPIEQSIVEEQGNGIRLPDGMRVGDTYEEVVNIDDEDVTYTVTKTDEELDTDSFSVMTLPQTVPVQGTASFTVRGEWGGDYAEFEVETRNGLMERVLRGSSSFIVGVTSEELTLVDARLATYDFRLSMAIPWLGGPSTSVGIRARITSPGANQNINYLETEVY